MSKFLLLLGVSGVGKSAIIEELIKLDKRFIYISPYMTRPNREGEKNKISITDEEMDGMFKRGELLVINKIYDIRYATPRLPILQALAEGNFPLLDWPVDRLDVMKDAFPGNLYVVYVAPPSLGELERRLLSDGRDKDGKRLEKGREELEMYWSSGYSDTYDLEIVSAEKNKISQYAWKIYNHYLQSFSRKI